MPEKKVSNYDPINCGCTAVVYRDGSGVKIRYCALHVSAEELAGLVEELLQMVDHASDCPSRHHGECICVRSRALKTLVEAGWSV